MLIAKILVRGFLTYGILHAVLYLRSPSFGEDAWVRWLRKVDEHPVRSTLALALLMVALGTRFRAVAPAESASRGEEAGAGARNPRIDPL